MVVKRINNALLRADQLNHAEGNDSVDYLQPIVADAEAGFGGVLNAFELMKAMIEAGAAGVHFEDQLASVKKCGHMGGKVLVPTREAVEKLNAARLAADVARRADDPRRAHRCRSRRSADHRRRRERPAVLHRRAHRRRLLQDEARASIRRSAAALPTRRTPISSGAKPASRIWHSRASSPKASTRNIRASCSPTTARRRSTGRRTSTTRRSPGSRRKSRATATSSSSSRSPASTR